ncbi:MAG: tyrosine-type recombinase/integrase [Phycisphaerales bacterium]
MAEQTPESQGPARAPAKRKTGAGKRARKFPLTLHCTGQYCKKIRGRIHYLGRDKQEALRKYYEQASALHSGTSETAALLPSKLTLENLCNLYLDHQLGRAKAGEIRERQYHEQKPRLKAFADFIGRNRLVAEIKTIELLNYRKKRIEDARAPVTINNELAIIKAMFHWAQETEIIEQCPRLAAVKKIPRKKVERQTFTPEEVRKLLAAASVQLKAMIFLGLNCGFGPTDCAELQWSNLDLKAGRVHFPRPKTGVDRNFILWPQTVEALKAVPVRGEFVFYTRCGNTWGWRVSGKSNDKPLTKAFKTLMKKAGVPAEKGTGFYTLRRTAATIAAGTGDVFAVQGILGHADLAMASTYVQKNKLTPQTDRAIEHAQKWLNGSITNPDDSE